jgi:signal transduction histidine kinase
MSLSASLQKVDHRIFLKGERQSAVLYLGQLAFSDLAAVDFASRAVAIVAQVLQVEYCLFWELKEEGRGLFLTAGTGEIDGLSPFPSCPLLPDSLEETTLSSSDPVIVEKSKNNFGPSLLDSMMAASVESGLSVRMGTTEKPYGILQVFSVQEQFFSQDDIHFLQNIANLAGLILHQGRCQRQQPASPAISTIKTQSTLQSGVLERDRYEIKNRLVESQERERLRLAQDLHDTPIQDLYGMIYQLDDLRDVIKDPEGEKILDGCNHTLHRVVNSLRTICRELRPPSLSPFGLEVAIRDHVEKFRDQYPDIQVTLELMQDRQVLSDSMRLGLFRIYQQAMNNVVRHAQASDVHIRFRRDEAAIILEVEDNGIGFEVPENWMDLVHKEHFGLLGIAERIESMRGKLEIVSELGNGTLVRVIAPYLGNHSG